MLALGGFLMQFMVQGAWGIVPAHLNELSPPAVRAILPGFAYQLGNLAMARMGPFQAGIAESHGGNYTLHPVVDDGGRRRRTDRGYGVWSRGARHGAAGLLVERDPGSVVTLRL